MFSDLEMDVHFHVYNLTTSIHQRTYITLLVYGYGYYMLEERFSRTDSIGVFMIYLSYTS